MDVTFSPALRVYAEMWEIAGRRREADAQFAQALAHIRSGTPDAMAKAFDLFKRSGAHNFTEAQFAAGWCCEHGCGTKRNYPQAIRWYKRTRRRWTRCWTHRSGRIALWPITRRRWAAMPPGCCIWGIDTITGRMWRVTRQRASAGITGPPRLAAMPPCRGWRGSTRRISTTRRRQGGIAATRRSASAGATSG